jgi:hypothetical protein
MPRTDSRPGRAALQLVPQWIHRQGQPRSLLLGKFRSGSHSIFRTSRKAAPRRGARSLGCRRSRRFYGYAYPEPAGFRAGAVSAPARYAEHLGEFILTYDSVRLAKDPDQAVMQFLSETYASAADAAKWHRTSLECPFGEIGKPRIVAST